jgi:hypothetical protein
MRQPQTLPAFTPPERDAVHRLLATKVAFMMGRKFEEGDWADVYSTAKGIPNRGWSNLNIDVMHDGLGVEHKMLRSSAHEKLKDLCGTRLMHPAATRSIRIPSVDGDPNEVMADVLGQYAALIQERRRKVAEDAGGREPDMRVGWLLWQSTLREFMYFEQEMLEPDPSDYFAEWRDSGGGARKSSRNLWIFEKESQQKRYSVTTSAGAKIQPYFDVPPPNDPNLYWFRVQGEELQSGLIRLWIAASTERELRRLLGDVSPEKVGLAISSVAAATVDNAGEATIAREEALPILLSLDSYILLATACPGVSDEHMVQLLVERLRRNGSAEDQ